MKTNLDKLVKAVDDEYKKAERAHKLSKKSAEDIAATSRTSWSAAGDRFHSQGTADLAKQRFETITLLKKEIEVKGESVLVNYEGKELFLVDNPVLIKGFMLVSTKSSIGQKILNK